MFIKVHSSYRDVIAICDTEIIGKKFEEGKKQLDVRENFYKGQEVNEEELIRLMQFHAREDATFNIVGQKSIDIGIKAGIINEKSIGRVQGIPFALKLV